MRPAIATVFVVLTLASCGGSSVDWTKYSPTVKTTIDKAAKAKDCTTLQKAFDNADSHRSTDLMVYIDTQMKKAGCYK